MTKKQGFTKDQKEELGEFFAKSFLDVIVPALELKFDTLEKKLDETREDLEKKIDDLELRLGRRIDRLDTDLSNRIEKVDRKIFNITDVHSDKLDNHEKRIKKLEVN